MRKKTTAILFISLIALGLAISGFALADRKLEITYPSFNLANAPTTVKTFLPDYLRYIFVFAIGISGFIIFGVMIVAGFRYFTSSGNPAVINDAKDQIFSAFIGVIVLLSSYILLRTINPQLVIMDMPSFQDQGMAIILKDQTGQEMKIKVSNPNLSDFGTTVPGGTDGGAVSLYLYHANFDQVDIYVHSEKNYQGIEKKITNASEAASFGFKTLSIEISWKIKGVYPFSHTDYKGNLKVYTVSQAEMPDFNDKAKSLQIIPRNIHGNNPGGYGAVLHEHADYKGECVVYEGEEPDLSGTLGNNKASSITIFRQLKPEELTARPTDSGVKITGKDSSGNPSTTGYIKDLYNMDLNSSPYVPPFGGAYIANDSISRVDFYNPGEYLVVLFKDIDYGGDCEVLTKTTDLSTHDLGRCIEWDVNKCPCSWQPTPTVCLIRIPCYKSCVSSFKIIPINPDQQ